MICQGCGWPQASCLCVSTDMNHPMTDTNTIMSDPFKLPDARGTFQTNLETDVELVGKDWTPELEEATHRHIRDLKDRYARGLVPHDEYEAVLRHLGSVGLAPGVMRPIGQTILKSDYPGLFKEAAEREPIDANALERMAKEQPYECFLKGSGVLKLIGAIRQLEKEVRLATSQAAPAVPDMQELKKRLTGLKYMEIDNKPNADVHNNAIDACLWMLDNFIKHAAAPSAPARQVHQLFRAPRQPKEEPTAALIYGDIEFRLPYTLIHLMSGWLHIGSAGYSGGGDIKENACAAFDHLVSVMGFDSANIPPETVQFYRDHKLWSDRPEFKLPHPQPEAKGKQQ